MWAVQNGWDQSSERVMRDNNVTMNHTFVNVFEFRGRGYIAEAMVKADEENISLVVDPEIPKHLDEAIEEFLGDWLGEVVDCHIELRKTVV
jgi:hypothetical protein|tara:strand:- start:287 stop:559 length:273 start_codon:yes stop_codon:yes gene_type:complete